MTVSSASKILPLLFTAAFFWAPAFADPRALPNATVQKATEGGENEFTTQHVMNLQFGKDGDDQGRPENRAYRDRWAEVMTQVCAKRGDCSVKAVKDDYWENDKEVHGKTRLFRVTYSDGWWYEVDIDVGVVEVRHKPSTLATLEQNEDRMQTDIWDVAHQLGLHVLPADATHIHLGVLSTFGNDVGKVRNYLVDCANHQEVAFLFSDDLLNAPPLSKIGPHQFAAFKKVIGEVDSGKITTVPQLEEQLAKRVFNRTHDNSAMGVHDHAEKYQADNVTRMGSKMPLAERTIEHREQPGAKSAKAYLDLVQLRIRRAAYVNSLPGRLELEKFNPRSTSKTLVTRLDRMLKEVGLDWKDYRKFFLPKFKNVEPKINDSSEPPIGATCLRQGIQALQ